MRKILLHRHGAYGDMIHCSHLPRLFKDNGWDFVGVSTGKKGHDILANNPFIDKFHIQDYGGKAGKFYYDVRLKVLNEEYDKILELTHSLEVGALAMEDQSEYFQHQKFRDKLGKDNYYDISTTWAGYPELCGKYRGEVFFTPEEIKIVENDLLRPGRFADNFKVMLNLSGTSPHKIFINAPEVSKLIIEQYPDAIVFTTGDRLSLEWDYQGEHERVKKIGMKKPFRQALLMAKYMNCVIGAESGLMCGASMWDVPTIQLMTAASIYNHCKYAKNDYSLQSPARCSPCFKGPYDYYGCPKRDFKPLCVYFNISDIMEQVRKIYANYRKERLFTVSQEATPELSSVRGTADNLPAG